MRSWGLIEWRKWRKPCCSASAFDLLFNWSSDFTVKDDFIEIPSGHPLNAYATMDARRQRPDAQTKAPTHMSFLRHPQVQRACALSSFQMTSSRKRDSWEKRTNDLYVRREEHQRRTLRKGKSDFFKSHKNSLHLQHTQKWGHVEGRLNKSFCLHAKYYVSPQSRTLGDTQKEGRQPLKQMIFFCSNSWNSEWKNDQKRRERRISYFIILFVHLFSKAASTVFSHYHLSFDAFASFYSLSKGIMIWRWVSLNYSGNENILKKCFIRTGSQSWPAAL